MMKKINELGYCEKCKYYEGSFFCTKCNMMYYGEDAIPSEYREKTLYEDEVR